MKILLTLFVFFFSYSVFSKNCKITNGEKIGDCSGINVNTDSKDYTINSYKSISGISGTVNILSGGNVNLSGISDEVIVSEGATVSISGIADKVINNGGKIKITGNVDYLILNSGYTEIYGIIDYISGKGEYKIYKGSIVESKYYD